MLSWSWRSINCFSCILLVFLYYCTYIRLGLFAFVSYSSSSSICTATLVGYGLLNYRWVFSAARFLQNAVTGGTSNPHLGGPVIRTFQLPPPGVPHVRNDASEPQQRKMELWARNCREFCRKWRLPRHFWVTLYAVNLHGTDGFTSHPKEGVLRIFSPEKSDGFGLVWTRELGYQRPPRLPVDHRSRICQLLFFYFTVRLSVTRILQQDLNRQHHSLNLCIITVPQN